MAFVASLALVVLMPCSFALTSWIDHNPAVRSVEFSGDGAALIKTHVDSSVRKAAEASELQEKQAAKAQLIEEAAKVGVDVDELLGNAIIAQRRKNVENSERAWENVSSMISSPTGYCQPDTSKKCKEKNCHWQTGCDTTCGLNGCPCKDWKSCSPKKCTWGDWWFNACRKTCCPLSNRESKYDDVCANGGASCGGSLEPVDGGSVGGEVCATIYQRCGGYGYPTCCQDGAKCQSSGKWSSCVWDSDWTPNMRRRRRTEWAACPWTDQKPLLLKAKDFANGTYRIKQCGYYKLEEDIEFDPKPVRPPTDSCEHKQSDGYFLGFFAAIAIEAKDVTLDCDGKTIKMSDEFHKQQRFFSIIELGSRPFNPGAGPPPLGNLDLSPGTLRKATGAVIKNCFLGKSSHHGIHGNGAHDVTIKDTQIQDFEVGGIAMNDGRKIAIDNVKIGPSLKSTFPAHLSQAQFLSHLTNAVLLADTYIAPLINAAELQLRGTTTNAGDVFRNLKKEVDQFLDDGTGDLAPIVGTKALPDGSAIYGILLHKTGPAAGVFGTHPLGEFIADDQELYDAVDIKDVEVNDLDVDVDAWIVLKMGEKGQVQGPGAAPLRFSHVWDDSTNRKYVGNPLSDAIIAVGAVKNALKDGDDDDIAAERLIEVLDGAFIPKEILAWAGGDTALDLADFTTSCIGDAMSHFNKGAMGFRMEYVDAPNLRGTIKIENIKNSGGPAEDVSICDATDGGDKTYIGNDAWGIRVAESQNVDNVEASVNTFSNIVAGSGGQSANFKSSLRTL